MRFGLVTERPFGDHPPGSVIDISHRAGAMPDTVVVLGDEADVQALVGRLQAALPEAPKAEATAHKAPAKKAPAKKATDDA